RYDVSDLDVAILQDLGYDTKGPVPKDNIVEVAHPSLFDIHSLVSGLSHSFWGQAAASLTGSHATQVLGTATAAHQSSLVITQAADQLSHLVSGAHSDISALTAAHVVAPTLAVDAHSALVHLDTLHVSDFAHQLHI